MSLFDTFKKAVSAVRAGVGAATDGAIQNHFNGRYGKLGQDAEPVRNLAIDRTGRTMEMELHLLGESAPVLITVARYEVVEREGKQLLEIERLQASRQWMNELFALKATEGKLLLPWELPSPVVLALR